MNTNRHFHKQKGFTLIEIVIVVAIMSVLIAVVVANFPRFIQNTDVNNGSQEFANVLRLAQSKTLASENNSQYGVYINTATTPHKYVLFRGVTYDTRITSADTTYTLPKSAEFYDITLGGGSEINFNRLNGTSQQSGSVTVRSKDNPAKANTIYVANSGAVHFTSQPVPSDELRVKDSRHVHVDYSRVINTGSERIELNFNNGQVVRSYQISAALEAGQINLLATVSVDGSDQVVSVKTHRLNNPDTQFSIHWDRRYNNASLKIYLSGDPDSIAEYTPGSASAVFQSAYVSNLQAQ